MMSPTKTVAVGSLLIAAACAQVGGTHKPATVRSSSASQPSELGAVRWLRDFDAGLAAAREQDRPMLMLFQEVPG